MNKLLVIGPILSEWSQIKYIADTLNFLAETHHITYLDPLEDMTLTQNFTAFSRVWKEKMHAVLSLYDVFIGFSLGGLILQECFPKVAETKLSNEKKFIFLSVPSFINKTLYDRLQTVIQQIENGNINEGVNKKNEYVFAPYPFPEKLEALKNPVLAGLRIIQGLKLVLNSDSRTLLKQTTVPYMHFVGEQSALVNQDNVIHPYPEHLHIVPKAGMRVLQDNPAYCIPHIKRYLSQVKG